MPRRSTRCQVVPSRPDSESKPSNIPPNSIEYSNSPKKGFHARSRRPTSQKNAPNGSSVGDKTDAALSRLAPYGRRCLLTLEERSAIEACHLISAMHTKSETNTFGAWNAVA